MLLFVLIRRSFTYSDRWYPPLCLERTTLQISLQKLLKMLITADALSRLSVVECQVLRA